MAERETPNLALLREVAQRIEPLLPRLAFLGGVVVDLFFTEPTARPSRATKDVDDVIDRVHYGQYAETLRDELVALGLEEDTTVGAPRCRWRFKDAPRQIVDMWTPKDPRRRDELDLCRSMTVDVFDTCDYIDTGSVVPTFRELFTHCVEQYPGQRCTVANTDIAFSRSIVAPVIDATTLMALTRWETDASPRMEGHLINGRFFSGSQDSWTFIASDLVRSVPACRMGIVGCDQAVCWWAFNSGLTVINPALSVRSHHHHSHRGELGASFAKRPYAYPEMTTFGHVGMVASHPWPADDMEWSIRCQ